MNEVRPRGRPPKPKPSQVALYSPKITLGNANKYDVYLTIEWGMFSKTVKLSREYPNLVNRVVLEIGTALKEGAESQPYEIR